MKQPKVSPSAVLLVNDSLDSYSLISVSKLELAKFPFV